MKSISQCCPGLSPRYLIPVCCPFPGLIIWHALQAQVMSCMVAFCQGNCRRAGCRVTKFSFLPNGWSDVGAYKDVGPSRPGATGCHPGLNAIHLYSQVGWYFLESSFDWRRSIRGLVAGFPFPGLAGPQSVCGCECRGLWWPLHEQLRRRHGCL